MLWANQQKYTCVSASSSIESKDLHKLRVEFNLFPKDQTITSTTENE